MKIVIASDSFKGSLTSLQVADAAACGVMDVLPGCDVVRVNVADGGEGTVSALVGGLGGEFMNLTVSDPLGRPVNVSYGVVEGGHTAVMEMSAASGLPLLGMDERNPMLTSTYGTGEMIAHALGRGCRKFLVGIGGSATNDAGTGMLSALGYRFLDRNGRQLRGCGASLGEICSVDSSGAVCGLDAAEFIVACDVDNPFCGMDGAAFVFAPQKGAGPDMVDELDRGMSRFAGTIKSFSGMDITSIPGAGAAGGLGGAFLAFLNAELVPGIEMVLDAIHFDSIIAGADIVITGEGRIDSQTAMGKAPSGILNRACRQGIPVIAIGGKVEYSGPVSSMGFASVVQVTPDGMPLEVAMSEEVAAANVRRAVSSAIVEYLKQGK